MIKRAIVLSVAVLLLLSGAVLAQGQKVTLDVKDAPFDEVIKMLFQGTNLNYSLEAGMDQRKVTVHLKDVDFVQALLVILRSTGMTYRKEGEVYMLAPKQQVPVEVTLPPGFPVRPGAPEKTSPAAEAPTRTEAIPLTFIEPADALAVLPPVQGIEWLKSSGDRIIVKGTDDAIAALKEGLYMVDHQGAFPMSIRITVNAEFTVTPKTGRPAKYKASTSNVGLEGTKMPIELSVRGGKTSDLSIILQLASAVTWYSTTFAPERPVPPSDETDKLGGRLVVSLSGNGSVRGHLPLEISKSFNVAVTTLSGAETIVASGSAQLPTGSVQFVVKAVPKVEEQRVKLPTGAELKATSPGINPRPPIASSNRPKPTIAK